MSFKGHGEYSLEVKENVLIMRCFGAWNEEKAMAFLEKVPPFVTKNFSGSFKTVVHLNDDSLGTPEALKLLGKTSLWAFDNGQQKIAFVCANQLQSGIVKQMQASERMKDLAIQYFFSEEQAYQWLNDK